MFILRKYKKQSMKANKYLIDYFSAKKNRVEVTYQNEKITYKKLRYKKKKFN